MPHRLSPFCAVTIAISLSGALAPSAHAQSSAAMPGMNMPPAAGGSGLSTGAFRRADEKMMHGMQGQPYTGDADRDFVAHMIPHHQGAIDMARVELKYGRDPDLRRLARNIVKAQEDEIRLMQRWQALHPVQR